MYPESAFVWGNEVAHFCFCFQVIYVLWVFFGPRVFMFEPSALFLSVSQAPPPPPPISSFPFGNIPDNLSKDTLALTNRGFCVEVMTPSTQAHIQVQPLLTGLQALVSGHIIVSGGVPRPQLSPIHKGGDACVSLGEPRPYPTSPCVEDVDSRFNM